MAGLGRARRSGLRAPCLLFAIGAIAAVEPPFLISTFDWRYELPQFSLIPIAAVLAVTALTRRAGDPAPAPQAAGQPAGARRRTGEPGARGPLRADEAGDRADAQGPSDDHPGPPGGPG